MRKSFSYFNADVCEDWERRPAEQMDYSIARRALRAMGLVLPTEAQWEYAARGGRRTPWCTGALPPNEQANLRDCSYHEMYGAVDFSSTEMFAGGAPVWSESPSWSDGFPTTAPVDTFPANGFGLHHIPGNVSEWCRDGYGDYGEGRFDESDGLHKVTQARDNVVRGGNFLSSAFAARSSARLIRVGRGSTSACVRPEPSSDPGRTTPPPCAT